VADVLVVGGNGFIGSHVVDALAATGHTVSAFDRFGIEPTRWEAPGVGAVAGDFLNHADVRDAVRGRDCVVHMLSTTDPATAEDDPTLDIRTNVTSSVDLFATCVAEGVGSVLFASTGGAIYGDQADKTLFSETDPTYPVSPYAIGKLTIENYLRYFRRKHGLRSTVLRLSNPYGPRQNPNKRQGIIPIFLRRLALGLPLTVYGDGTMVRDYIYVADLAAMVAAVVSREPRHSLYNVGSGTGHSVLEILDAVRRVTGIEPTVAHRPRPSTFVDRVILDTRRFTEEFGRFDTRSLDEGIALTWQEIVDRG
jgi:UDP-glucose 4-epimerase